MDKPKTEACREELILNLGFALACFERIAQKLEENDVKNAMRCAKLGARYLKMTAKEFNEESDGKP